MQVVHLSFKVIHLSFVSTGCLISVCISSSFWFKSLILRLFTSNSITYLVCFVKILFFHWTIILLSECSSDLHKQHLRRWNRWRCIWFFVLWQNSKLCSVIVFIFRIKMITEKWKYHQFSPDQYLCTKPNLRALEHQNSYIILLPSLDAFI